jgi:hypothetical protein
MDANNPKAEESRRIKLTDNDVLKLRINKINDHPKLFDV